MLLLSYTNASCSIETSFHKEASLRLHVQSAVMFVLTRDGKSKFSFKQVHLICDLHLSVDVRSFT